MINCFNILSLFLEENAKISFFLARANKNNMVGIILENYNISDKVVFDFGLDIKEMVTANYQVENRQIQHHKIPISN